MVKMTLVDKRVVVLMKQMVMIKYRDDCNKDKVVTRSGTNDEDDNIDVDNNDTYNKELMITIMMEMDMMILSVVMMNMLIMILLK